MRIRHSIIFCILIVTLAACNAVIVTEGISTTTPPSKSSAFPYAAELNSTLPKENLLLARHYYGDPDEQNEGAEICYDVGIYSDNTYVVISCQPNFTYPAPTGRLDEMQVKFIHQWTETFQSFDEPAIHGLLKFNGNGSNAVEFSNQVSMHAILSRIEWNARQYESGGGTPVVVFHARSILANQLDLLPDDVHIQNFEAMNFPDACLESPKSSELCEPIVMQGYRIYLIANNLMYEYHTDLWGYDIRPFGEPQIAPTQSAGG